MVPLANSRLGFLALSQNDPDRAEELCVEAIRELQEQAQTPGMDFALDVLASVAAARGGVRRAARLWGGVAGYREATGAPWLLEERAIIEPRIDAARSRLEEAVWQEEWEKGRSMTLDQAVGYALEVSEGRAMEQDKRAGPARNLPLSKVALFWVLPPERPARMLHGRSFPANVSALTTVRDTLSSIFPHHRRNPRWSNNTLSACTYYLDWQRRA